MKYVSICDGIGAAHVALQPLGFRCVGVSEIDKYCNQLISRKYAHRNFGDFTDWENWAHFDADCVVAGTPCTAFSFMGRRGGTEDPAGKLTPAFVRFVCRHKPRWFIWENVPGVLSISGGRLFEWMCHEFQKFGYGLGYRIFDARYFGVAQRRRRIFLVGNLGGRYRAAAALFDIAPSEVFTPKSTRTKQEDRRTDAVDFRNDRYRNNGNFVGTLIACQGGGIERIGSVVLDNNRPRWLTPLERERLMGFPDNYTQGFSDSQRHKMLGNSMAVPVVKWIGERILQQEQGANTGLPMAG
jgi:DNA (cytosine-5)-methyltransferase 1